MKEGEYELLMVGDSITHNFESIGEKVWKKHFEPLKALNLGFGGDRTNHVLWRLDHLPKPKDNWAYSSEIILAYWLVFLVAPT